MKGTAHVYKRAHINTDEIIPAKYLNLDKEEELAQHAMEDIDPQFLKNVKKGDILVAGDDFGCGSSREHAVWALRGSGIRAIIANSFARIFYRNCINNGFLAIECDIINKVNKNDELEIDLDNGIIENLTKKEEYKFIPLPKFVLDIMDAGGLMNHIKSEVS